ncbi:B9D2 protein, partial [Xiphorhynchus elegans]|nr:B9D2 protein [Xiphorhynchus elegans]
SGYGVVAVPTSPGCHHVTCVTWRPRGSWGARLAQRFLGGGPQLRSPSGVVAGGAERFRLRTESSGSVRLSLGVLPRNLGRFGVAA